MPMGSVVSKMQSVPRFMPLRHGFGRREERARSALAPSFTSTATANSTVSHWATARDGVGVAVRLPDATTCG